MEQAEIAGSKPKANDIRRSVVHHTYRAIFSTPPMRNIFDQYDKTEDRLTHAIAVTLHEDRAFLSEFLKLTNDFFKDDPRKLTILTQQLPGESTSARPGQSRPDLIIHDREEHRCIAIEVKAQAPLNDAQLHEHGKTLRDRGFDHVRVLALTARAQDQSSEAEAVLQWRDIFTIAHKFARTGSWCQHLCEYLALVQGRLWEEGNMLDGSLTQFTGFPFDDEYAFTIERGRAHLRKATQELRTHTIVRQLGLDLDWEKPSISDRGDHVFETLLFDDHPGGASKDFRTFPHLTLSLHRSFAQVEASIPNGCSRECRRRLVEQGEDGLRDLHAQVLKRAGPIMASGGVPMVSVVQRHAQHAQRLAPYNDAELRFHLNASRAEDVTSAVHKMKSLPHWMDTLFALLDHRAVSSDVNLHIGYLIRLPWTMPEMGTRDAIDVIAQSWQAMMPVMDVVRGKK
jgi:hypothetical protein